MTTMIHDHVQQTEIFTAQPLPVLLLCIPIIQCYTGNSPQKEKQTNKKLRFVVFAIFHVLNTFHHERDSATNMSTLNPELGRNVHCWFLGDCMSQFQHTTDPLDSLPPHFPSNLFSLHCFLIFLNTYGI